MTVWGGLTHSYEKKRGEKERYKHLNAEFKEQQEKKRKPSSVISAKKQRKTTEWERLEISSRKRDTKGTFHAKMGSIKNRNVMDLTEAEDIKKRWLEYTEELYNKDLHNPDNHDGAVTQLEPDVLQCEVKWALGSIITNKASGGDGIPVELFQILKDEVVKMLHSVCQQIWKTQQWPQDQKRCFYSNPKEKQCQRMFKLLYKCTHFTCHQDIA